MPLNKSAQKHERQDIIRRQRNRILKSKVRTAYVKLLNEINSKNKEEIEKKLKIYMSVIDKAVKKHVFHRNKGGRLKANIAKRIKLSLNEKQNA